MKMGSLSSKDDRSVKSVDISSMKKKEEELKQRQEELNRREEEVKSMIEDEKKLEKMRKDSEYHLRK